LGKKDATVYTSCQLVKAFAIFINPFTPSVSEKIWQILNIKETLSWDELEKNLPAGHEINVPEIVVEKIDMNVVKAKYNSLKKR
jgi:methionyl-tRNA synthetase